MRVVIQRVSKASVSIQDNIVADIDHGLLILLGIENLDLKEDSLWLANKISRLRIFDDGSGIMNRSIIDINGDIIVVSQFTLYARTKKGSRPSYIKAAKADIAIPIYKRFIHDLSMCIGKNVQSGEFGADMKISMINDGPVSIIMDTKNKE